MQELEVNIHLMDGGIYQVRLEPDVSIKMLLEDFLDRERAKGEMDPGSVDEWQVTDVKSGRVLEKDSTLNENRIYNGAHLKLRKLGSDAEAVTSGGAPGAWNRKPESQPWVAVAKPSNNGWSVAKWLLVCAGSLAILLAGGGAIWWAGANTGAPVRERMNQLQSSLESAQRELAAVRAERDQLKAKVMDASATLDTGLKQTVDLATERDKAKADNAATKQQLAAALKNLKDAQDQKQEQQRIADGARTAATSAQADVVALRRQLQQAQQRFDAGTLALSQSVSQKDERIKDLTKQVEALERTPLVDPSSTLKKGDHGTIVWFGPVPAAQMLVIDKGRPSFGKISGSIPRRLCKLELWGTRSSVTVPPSAQNGFNHMELRVEESPIAVVRIDWTVIK